MTDFPELEGRLAESSVFYVTTTDGDSIKLLPGEWVVGTSVNPHAPAVWELVRDGVAIATITGTIERV